MVAKRTGMTTKKKLGLALVLLIPAVGVLWLVVSFVFWVVALLTAGDGVATGQSFTDSSWLNAFKTGVNWLLGVIAIIGIIGFIPGIVLLVTESKKKQPNEKQDKVDNELNYDCDGERFVANLIDAGLTYLIIPLFFNIYYYYTSGGDTIGRRIVGIKIIDFHGGKPSTGQLIGRFFSKFLSGIPLYLGFIWILFDKRHQGRHDKLADTLVIKYRKANIPLVVGLIAVYIIIVFLVRSMSEN